MKNDPTIKAERVKIEVGSAMTELDDGPEDYEIRGRDLMTGIPKVIKISYSEVAFALDKSVSKLEEWNSVDSWNMH